MECGFTLLAYGHWYREITRGSKKKKKVFPKLSAVVLRLNRENTLQNHWIWTVYWNNKRSRVGETCHRARVESAISVRWNSHSQFLETIGWTESSLALFNIPSHQSQDLSLASRYMQSITALFEEFFRISVFNPISAPRFFTVSQADQKRKSGMSPKKERGEQNTTPWLMSHLQRAFYEID